MLETFISRTPFSYNIKSLDELLQTKEIPDSFLAYDEQVLSILISAGIPASDAYVCLKGIKKKKMDKVEMFKEQFKEGFAKHLKEDENATDQEAEEIVNNVWGIIEASASYLFNASHSLCMACDSLYVAWLKAHYPYELYATMLEVFSEKKKKEKVAAIIAEMRKHQGIDLLMGRWGQNNQGWLIDKENKRISQNLASILYMSPQVAKDLYTLSQQEEAYIGSEFTKDVYTPEAKKRIAQISKKLKPIQAQAEQFLKDGGDEFDNTFLALYDEGYPLEQELKRIYKNDSSYESRGQEIKKYAKLDCFTNVLRAMHIGTCLDARQIQILIGLNYFEQFGHAGKLRQVCDKYFSLLKNKNLKSFEDRLETCREYEESIPDTDIPVGERLRCELENIGLCLSVNSSMPGNLYFVTDVDDKYSIKLNLYSVRRGTTGEVKVAKKNYHAVGVGSCIMTKKIEPSPKYTYNKGKRTPIPGEEEYWVKEYTVMQKGSGVA